MQNEDFKIGFRRIVEAWMDPSKMTSEMTTRYWKFIKDFRSDTFAKAVEIIIDLPYSKIPPPAAMAKVCKEIEHRSYYKNEYSPEMNELIKHEIVEMIDHLESLSLSQMTVRRTDKLRNLRERLERMKWKVK